MNGWMDGVLLFYLPCELIYSGKVKINFEEIFTQKLLPCRSLVMSSGF